MKCLKLTLVATLLLPAQVAFAQTVTGRGFASGAGSNFQALRQEILHLTSQINSSQAEISQLRAELNRAVPAGAVSTFNLAGCPEGWSPLNAAQGRFIVGAGTLDGDSYAPGDTGGSARHALSVDELPEHRHGVRMQFGYGSESTYYIVGNNSGGRDVGYHPAYSEPVGGNEPHENRPPYLSLLYCQRN